MPQYLFLGSSQANVTLNNRVILKKTVKIALLTVFYGIKCDPMVTASLEFLRECVSVPCKHHKTRVTVF